MKPAGRSFVAVTLLLAASLPATQAEAKAKRQATPAPKTLAEPLKNPMIFYLAKGEPDSCGQGCREWIAAEGAITQGTAERMRAFLKRSSAKLPIYFNSPGGITSESVAMGRLMRERGVTARVARTIPQGCETDAQGCAKSKRSGREQVARLSSSLSQCNSACVYAIVGARVREIPPEAHLGIHASRTVVVGGPQGLRVSAEMRANFRNQSRLQIKRYLADMGIQPALFDAAEKVSHESIRALSREEMVRFGIDTRSVVESGWIYDESIAKRGGIFKSIDVTEAGGSGYSKTLLRLSCVSNGEFLVGYAREVGPKEDSFFPLKLVGAKEEFKLPPPQEAVTGKTSKKRYDVRRAWVPARFFASAAAEDDIELASDAVEGKAGVTRLSTLGLASALSTLSRRCGQSAVSSPGGAALAPRHRP